MQPEGHAHLYCKVYVGLPGDTETAFHERYMVVVVMFEGEFSVGDSGFVWATTALLDNEYPLASPAFTWR